MPGFIAAVNLSVHVPVGFTHLYSICFLSGFAISSTVFVALHHFLPARNMQDWVHSGQTSREVIDYYRETCDSVAVDAREIYLTTKDVEIARPMGF